MYQVRTTDGVFRGWTRWLHQAVDLRGQWPGAVIRYIPPERIYLDG